MNNNDHTKHVSLKIDFRLPTSSSFLLYMVRSLYVLEDVETSLDFMSNNDHNNWR